MLKKFFPNIPQADQSGFTLIELLVVISIIGMLASITITYTSSANIKARNARWHADAQEIQKAYELYYADNARYPYGAGQLPVEALAPYSKIIPTTFTQGVASYFTLSRSPGDPDWVAVSDDASGCIRIKDGYVIAVGSEAPNTNTINDGGIEPSYYERLGGDYKIYTGGGAGYYAGGANCPNY